MCNIGINIVITITIINVMGVVLFVDWELPRVSFDYNGGSILVNPRRWWRKPATLDSTFEFFLLILYCIAARSEPPCLTNWRKRIGPATC